MKTTFGSMRRHCLRRVGIFLITAALVAGIVGRIPFPSEIQDWHGLDQQAIPRRVLEF
jgi:hypothetical protein